MADGNITVKVSTQAAQDELQRLRDQNATLKRDLVYARDGLTKGRTRMREDIERLTAELANLREKAGWRPIAEAPRGSGEDGPASVKHPDYVEPPQLLLWSADGMRIGYYDWYYHPGYGMGAEDGNPAWREAGSGEPIYGATHWQPIPEPPKEGA